MQAKIYLDAVRRKGKISDVFYGSFVERMGRCVYGGVYEEGSPLSDEKGWRRDVEEKVRGLNLDIVRYPGEISFPDMIGRTGSGRKICGRKSSILPGCSWSRTASGYWNFAIGRGEAQGR